MASHPDAQGVSSRQRLLRAAKRLFAAQGYEQTATSAIAREAGTSESQLMRYFGGKVGILEALFDDSWADLNQRIAHAASSGASHRERILSVVDAFVTALGRDLDFATLVLFESRRVRGSEPRVRIPAGFASFAEVVKSLVREGQGAREMDPTLDAAAVTSAMIGAAEAMVRERLLARERGGRAFAEREIRQTADAMLAGFSGRPSIRGKRAGTAKHR
jgi:AcrR family transcriptional regulator